MREIFDDRMMRNVLSESQMGMWIIEMVEGKVPRMYIDDMMLKLLGLIEHIEPEQCYQFWFDNIVEEYCPMVLMTVEKAISEGQAEVEYSWNHPKDGAVFVRCGGIYDDTYKKGIRIRGYHQNINDIILLRNEKDYLKELNEEILESLHKLFFSVLRVNLKNDEITVLRNTRDTQSIAAGCFTYTCYIEKNISELVHPEHQNNLLDKLSIENILKMKKKGMDRYTVEYRRLFRDEYRWVSLTVYFGEEKTIDDWVILASQDIHEQKCVEEHRKFITANAYDVAQKANQAKSEFLSRMSHDMRTPMNAIKGMTTLALINIDEKQKLKDYLEKIQVSTKLMIQMVNEVLDMTKIESGAYTLERQAFKLSSLVDNLKTMVMPMIQQKHQAFKIEIKNVRHNNLIGDTLRIQQILMNILSNANKYTPENGHIYMEIEEIPALNRDYGKFCFEIIDDGIGMDAEFAEHIFEPFARAEDSRISKISGTGLGMAIAQSIIQLLHGTIHVESQPDKGSRFIVVINLELQKEGEYYDALESIDDEWDMSELHFKNKRILLVEDNEINSEIAKEMLEMSGAVVEIAVDGKKAVEAFTESSQSYYDIIFMDIQMPIMNGNDAAIAIRSLQREDAKTVPIIAMTANAFAQDISLSRQSGMNEHLAKPIDINQLAAVLKKWLK